MRIKIKIISALLLALLFTTQPVWAAGPPSPSIFGSALALSLLLLQAVLLLVIGILANMLIGTADIKLKKRKEEKKAAGIATILIPIFLLLSSSLFAQGTGGTQSAVATTIGDMTKGTFYIMIAIIFVELLVILALLMNIRSLLTVEKEKLNEAILTEKVKIEIDQNKLSWWDRFNRLRPVSQESELDLGHDYDGIRELNNRLPPWWLYGFYLCIIFAGVYLWRFHVSHNGPSSAQEYENSITEARLEIDAYIKAKGEAVDENSVTRLTDKASLDEGKIIFEKSCVTCHKITGGGDVGPNLTDDFWLHGNDIKTVFKTIRYGFNAMPQWQMAYSNKQIQLVASYVKSLHGTNPPNPKAPQGVEMKEIPVANPSDSTKKDTTNAAALTAKPK